MNNKNTFWGLIFVAIAIYVLFGSSRFFGGIGLGSLILTGIFAGLLIRGIADFDFGGILFPSAFLAIIWDDQLGITHLTPWPVLLAALLGTIGLNLLFNNSKVKIKNKIIKYNNEHTNYSKVDTASGQYVYTKVSFGGIEKYIESDDLRRVDISAFCGGAEIYLDKACIPSGEAIVTFDCKCSGIELYVPRDWNVVNKLDVSMGAMDFSGEPSGAGVVDLILIGNASFCGIEIRYV